MACSYHFEGNTEIGLLHVNENRVAENPKAFASSPYTEYAPVFSNDGRFISYSSGDQDLINMYVIPYPMIDRKWQISKEGGGGEAFWSPVLPEIYYIDYDVEHIKWMVVPYTTDPEFKPGIPRLLFEGDFLDLNGINWDVAPDGRILTLKPASKSKMYTNIRVIHHWFKELKSKFEAGN